MLFELYTNVCIGFGCGFVFWSNVWLTVFPHDGRRSIHSTSLSGHVSRNEIMLIQFIYVSVRPLLSYTFHLNLIEL